ncbi:putative pentatricopeptide repeat-containing protein At5g08490 [Cynara cardunculus var. scolymus]|uniref:putative pentatricopeptide repeat-containing protein At5g08490 n=1 Tax=Cynara cardunculus var. scolymus TaxID=59895 RepID=UPI000D6236C8|nr:putative pentatricopeptide repeat-containing protein At5g08490 [Cynara cardunculus var. scolymus]
MERGADITEGKVKPVVPEVGEAHKLPKSKTTVTDEFEPNPRFEIIQNQTRYENLLLLVIFYDLKTLIQNKPISKEEEDVQWEKKPTASVPNTLYNQNLRLHRPLTCNISGHHGDSSGPTTPKSIDSQISHPDAVTWNIMLSGLAGTRVHDAEVMKLFNAMNLGQHVKASSVTAAIVLPVCVRLNGLNLGKSVHSYVIKLGLESQTLVGNALVSMYMKFGYVSSDAYKVFDEMSERDVVSWNAMVAGLVENGLVFGAFAMFRRMIAERTWPNYATIANILPVCALLDSSLAYRFGKEIHGYALHREELVADVSVANSLIWFLGIL